MLDSLTATVSQTFAANRASGEVAFDVLHVDGVTRRGKLLEFKAH